MNTLREMIERWRRPFDGAPEDDYERGLQDEANDCADELSAEIPKWEALVEAAENLLGRTPSGTPNPIVRWSQLNELRAALSEVRHD